MDFKRIYNWFNNKKPKGTIRPKLSKETGRNASPGSSKHFFQQKAKKGEEDADLPDVKLGHHKIK